MLNCSDPECILHHHHYYHGRVQHHLQDDRMHHEHPTHHPMSATSDGAEDSIIQGYLNDTNSELSSLSHLDAPNESLYMICGVLIAMLLVGLIIILLAVTIRMRPMRSPFLPRSPFRCDICRKFFSFGKLRKREESSTTVVTHAQPPEGVFQQTVSPSATVKRSTQPATLTLPIAPSDASLCSVASNETCETAYSLPLFLYSNASSHTSLAFPEQTVAAHHHQMSSIPEDVSHKPQKRKFRRLVRKKPPPPPTYAIPIEFQDQLKKIYVY